MKHLQEKIDGGDEVFDFSEHEQSCGLDSSLAENEKKPKPRRTQKPKPQRRKFNELEDSYYFQLQTFFSIEEMRELLNEFSISTKGYTFDYYNGKEPAYKNAVVIRDKRGEVFINQIFADKYEDFTKVCTRKHFPIYSDVQDDKFSFNFTPEELITWLEGYPATIYRNFEYDRAVHAIVPTIENSDKFVIERTIQLKIKNLYASSLNVQEKKYSDFAGILKETLPILLDDFETHPVSANIKHNNGWIDDVLTQGAKYLKSHAQSDLTDYWFGAFSSIFTLTFEDFVSIVSFVVHSIRVRLYANDQSMRVIIITGDSGVGKDSFLQGCLTGLNYKKANDVVLRGSLKGATGFSAARIEKIKRIMYNYISDNLSATNQSTDLDTITAPQIGVENKSKDQRFIQKRFNTIITNNDPHVIFSKDKDHNAIARRTNFCSLKYAKGCKSVDYTDFYTCYDGKFDDFWAGFLAFCFELEKNKEGTTKLSNLSRQYTLDNLHKLFYQGNDDNRIIDFLTEIYNGRVADAQNPLFSRDQSNEFVDTKAGVLRIKSISDYWRKDNKFSGEAIKRVAIAHIKGVRINSSYRPEYGTPRRAALSIPISFFTGEDCDEPEETTEKTNLIESFKKYL